MSEEIVEILAAAIDESFIGMPEGGTKAFAKARAEFVIKALEAKGYTLTRSKLERYVVRQEKAAMSEDKPAGRQILSCANNPCNGWHHGSPEDQGPNDKPICPRTDCKLESKTVYSCWRYPIGGGQGRRLW